MTRSVIDYQSRQSSGHSTSSNFKSFEANGVALMTQTGSRTFAMKRAIQHRLKRPGHNGDTVADVISGKKELRHDAASTVSTMVALMDDHLRHTASVAMDPDQVLRMQNDFASYLLEVARILVLVQPAAMWTTFVAHWTACRKGLARSMLEQILNEKDQLLNDRAARNDNVCRIAGACPKFNFGVECAAHKCALRHVCWECAERSHGAIACEWVDLPNWARKIRGKGRGWKPQEKGGGGGGGKKGSPNEQRYYK